MTWNLTRRFPLPPAAAPAAESWRNYGTRRPLHPRDAATIVLVRDGATGPEVLLTCRSPDSPLGAVSFPGGVCIPADEDPVGWFGRPLSQWSQQLGETDYGRVRRFVVAGVRELFEETGYLLAGADQFTLAEDLRGEEAIAARQALANEDLSLAQILDRRGWGIRSDLIRPIGRWASPDFAHRRFNTHYFVAAAPPAQSCSVAEGLQSWLQWVNVAELIQHQHTSWLGDMVNAEHTRGLNMAQITTPAVQLFCEALNRYSGSVAFLLSVFPRTAVPFLQAQLSEGSEPELVVEFPESARDSMWATPVLSGFNEP
ncbi:NUDIX hydrolase [Micrococcoides hystricis]|uniref:NUDIX hydrolase n=1 Tax=Micrococcoides hystricis TaxID=1572761 RepID=A0ABV6PD43_9MICC